jgi:hypothetical protein
VSLFVTVIFVGALLVAGASLIALVLAVRRAVDGQETDAGFHQAVRSGLDQAQIKGEGKVASLIAIPPTIPSPAVQLK